MQRSRGSAWCRKAELSDRADSETPKRLFMQSMYDVGLDAHKRKISECVKDGGARFSPKDGLMGSRHAF